MNTTTAWTSLRLRHLRAFVFSRRIIPLFKGTLAYIIVLVLISSPRFDALTAWPVNFQNAIIPTLVAGTGQSIGACAQGSLLVLLGVAVGSLNFAILASLAKWTIVQGIVFAFSVYWLSYFKAGDERLFIVFLTGILMGFDGVIISKNNNNQFLPKFLLADSASYLFGLAVAILVNVLVFPTTSEKELREMLVTSLDHLESLSRLVARAYVIVASEQEMNMGDVLMQVIRADFAFLTQILQNTSMEINWSAYSMQEYRLMVEHIRGLQQAIFRSFNALRLFDLEDKRIFARVVLPSSRHLTIRIRRHIDRALREISAELGGKRHGNPPVQTGYQDFLDTEREAARLRRQYGGQSNHINEYRGPAEGSLFAERRRREGADEDYFPPDVERNLETMTSEFIREVDDTKLKQELEEHRVDIEGAAEEDQGGTAFDLADGNTYDPKGSIQNLKRDFVRMQKIQGNILYSILMTAQMSPEMPLRLEEKLPSLRETFGQDWDRKHKEGGLRRSADRSASASRQRPRESMSRVRTVEHEGDEGATWRAVRVEGEEDRGRSRFSRVAFEQEEASLIQSSDLVQLSKALATVYSLLFSTESVINQIGDLYNIVRPTPEKRKRRLHIHFFPGKRHGATHGGRTPSIYTQNDEELSVKEALAILEEKEFSPEPVTFWQKVDGINQFFKTDQSIYALKAAVIAGIFAVLFYAPVTHNWFNSYAMQASLLAAMVAFERTLGLSLIMFATQVIASGLGTITGLIILEIFHNVGGYGYNPYGVCILAALYSLPLQYILYEKPRLFVFGLLALASCGSIIIHEIVVVNVIRIPFDSPALQTGKAFVALVTALGLVLVFQLFILRTPARRILRLAMGELVRSTLAYTTVHQAYVRAALPDDPKKAAPVAALRRVERELAQRENQIIRDMLGISGLIIAAAAEPSSVPWRPHIPHRLLQANGLLIDRLQEARIALGHEPFDPFIMENMIKTLWPYQRQAHLTAKISLYLSATSLLSKSPLPRDTVITDQYLQDFIEDAGIISSRLAATERGATAVKEDSFTRFWFFILCIGDIPRHLSQIESVCKEMFGTLEDDPKMK